MGPRILDAEGELQLSARREISALSGFLGRTSLLTRLFPKSSLVKSQFPAVTDQSHPTSVDWVSGACMVVRRETLRDIGHLDERFFMYFEDADLCRRARAAGSLIFFLPQVEIVHQTGASSRSRPKAIWLLHKSAFLYHRRARRRRPLWRLQHRCSGRAHHPRPGEARDLPARQLSPSPFFFFFFFFFTPRVPSPRPPSVAMSLPATCRLVGRRGLCSRGQGSRGATLSRSGSFHRMVPSYSGA